MPREFRDQWRISLDIRANDPAFRTTAIRRLVREKVSKDNASQFSRHLARLDLYCSLQLRCFHRHGQGWGCENHSIIITS